MNYRKTLLAASIITGLCVSGSLFAQDSDQATNTTNSNTTNSNTTSQSKQDQAKARQAVGVAVTTARKLDLKDPDQLRTMDFDTSMGKYATGYAGLKQLLTIYGLSVDDTLNSIKLTPVSNSHGHAVMKVDYTLLGKPLSTESKLVLQDGRWYSEDMLDSARKAHQHLSQPAGSASVSADAGTVAKQD